MIVKGNFSFLALVSSSSSHICSVISCGLLTVTAGWNIGTYLQNGFKNLQAPEEKHENILLDEIVNES